MENSRQPNDGLSNWTILKKNIEFVSETGKRFRITIYDDGTYSIKWPCIMSFKHVKHFSNEWSNDEFAQIDPGFKEWLMTELKTYYEL